MNTLVHKIKKPIALALASLLIVACSSAPTKPDGADNVRNKLTRLQSNSQLASRAPVAIQEAELAVRAAEKSQKDKEQEKHLVFIADRKVDIASARAQARLYEDQRATLSDQRQTARLDSRTREADNARSDAKNAQRDADMARMDTEAAMRETDDLQQQIDELNAKETNRGLVVTLGDLLFDSGRSELKGGSASHLGKLAMFLNKYQDRSVIIEGHTDNVGSDNANLGLSQRRANSVRSYLVSQGISSDRLVATGMGENSPVAGNESSSGRQQNRRVEVIISNPVASR